MPDREDFVHVVLGRVLEVQKQQILGTLLCVTGVALGKCYVYGFVSAHCQAVGVGRIASKWFHFCGYKQNALQRVKHIAWTKFFETVVEPWLAKLFTSVLRNFSQTVVTGNSTMHLTLTQNKVALQIEETMSLHSQDDRLPETLRASMPKAFYWFGTSLLTNYVVATCVRDVLANDPPPAKLRTVTDELFLSSVNFLHRRYIFGQAVLACSVKERAGPGVDTEPAVDTDPRIQMLLRVLRGEAGSCITRESILSANLRLRRGIEVGSLAERTEVEDIIQALLATFCDLGLGVPVFTGQM